MFVIKVLSVINQSPLRMYLSFIFGIIMFLWIWFAVYNACSCSCSWDIERKRQIFSFVKALSFHSPPAPGGLYCPLLCIQIAVVTSLFTFNYIYSRNRRILQYFYFILPRITPRSVGVLQAFFRPCLLCLNVFF